MRFLKNNIASIFWSIIILILLAISYISANPQVLTMWKKKPHIEPPPAMQTAPTTQRWWSPATTFPSEIIYATPGAYQLTELGFSFTHPQITVQDTAITSELDEWCVIGDDTPLTQASVAGYGDWNVQLDVWSEKDTWQLHLSEGSPTVYMTHRDIPVFLSCAQAKFTRLESGIVVKYPDRAYLIEAQDPEQVTLINLDQATLTSKKSTYRISILPDHEETTIDLFLRQPWSITRYTQVDWQKNRQSIDTYYTWFTDQDQPILTTLWPHHQASVTDLPSPILAVYPTIYGPLHLIQTKQFSTELPLPTFSNNYTAIEQQPQREQITEAIKKDLQKYQKNEDLVEFKSIEEKIRWIHSTTNVLLLADAYQIEEGRDNVVQQLTRQIETDLIEPIDDAYLAYYIWAVNTIWPYATEQHAQFKILLAPRIEHFTSTNRQHSEIPFLQKFSLYQGSTTLPESESPMHPLYLWTALHTYATLTEDDHLVKITEWLTAQELASNKAYTFGQPIPFPEGYTAPFANYLSATQRSLFAPERSDSLQNILPHWLPISPVSTNFTEFLPSTYWEFVSKRAELSSQKPLQDIAEYLSLYGKPDEVQESITKVKAFPQFEHRSLFLHFTYSIQHPIIDQPTVENSPLPE